jgi:uncharacterized protein YxeA
VEKPTEQAAPTLATILHTVVSIQTALIAMKKRATKAEERAVKKEERALKAEENINHMKQQMDARALKAEETISHMTQQMDPMTNQLKQAMDVMTVQLDQIANAPALSSPSPSYADVARTAPNSSPSNIRTLSSMNSTPSALTDTLYCAVDISRVSEEDRSKVQPGNIRQAIKQEMRVTDGHANWALCSCY